MNHDNFSMRQIGPCGTQAEEMLTAVGAASLDELINQTIPADIRAETLCRFLRA